jgi:putative serine protease PepD
MSYEFNNGEPPIPGTNRAEQNDQPTAEQPTIRQPRVQQASRNEDRGSGAYVPHQGYEPRQSYEPAPVTYVEPKPQKSGTWKGVVGGAVAGAAVSAALVAALMGTGVISTGSSNRLVTESSAGQTISIATASEDTTVAQAVAAKCLPSVASVYVTTEDGSSGIGSGVILDTDGNIITNWHVAGDASAISVTIDGQSYDATLVGGDASSDVAVIRADLNGALVTPIEVGNSSDLVVGDWVMTLGSPLGLDQSASSGIVSALYRNTLMTGTTGNTLYTNLIQVDAAINGGNSGGALVNSKGQLVGINTLYANGSGSQAFAGIGFAIPGNYAVDIANKVIKGEQVTHAYIGLSCATVNSQNAQANHLSVSQGAYVAEVAENSPGAAAGIQVGDIITKIGENDVTSSDGFILAVRSHSVGEQVEVKFVRDGKEQSVNVTLGSDEELQAKQEEKARKQQEEYQQQLQQYEEYLNQQNQQNQRMGWPFGDGYSWPWETWNWDYEILGNPGSYTE